MHISFHCSIPLEVKYPSPGDQCDGLLQLNTSLFQIKISLLDLLLQAILIFLSTRVLDTVREGGLQS